MSPSKQELTEHYAFTQVNDLSAHNVTDHNLLTNHQDEFMKHTESIQDQFEKNSIQDINNEYNDRNN